MCHSLITGRARMPQTEHTSSTSQLDLDGHRPLVPLAISQTQQSAITALAKDVRVFRAPLALARKVCVPNDALIRAEGEADLEVFWRERPPARRLTTSSAFGTTPA